MLVVFVFLTRFHVGINHLSADYVLRAVTLSMSEPIWSGYCNA